MKSIILISLIVFSQLTFSKSVTISSKQFSESVTLSEMLGILLEENYNFRIKRKHALGGTQVAFEALKNGSIDIYPEYTGTGYVSILKESGLDSASKIHSFLQEEFKKRFGIVWSEPLGFNNTYAVAVKNDDKRFENIKTISQLSEAQFEYRLAAPYEFMERKDGYAAMKMAYNLELPQKNVKSMEAGLMYPAIRNGSVDVIFCYSTDGKIKGANLRLLEDDKSFFPPYEVAFTVRKEVYDKYPELRAAIGILEDSITEEEMINLNFLVDGKKQDSQTVARNFLIERGLIEGDLTTRQASTGFFDYTWNKRAYLLKITKEHLILSFLSLLIAMLISIPLGIMMTRIKNLEKFIFPVVNTIQTIPSLALLGFMIPFLGIGVIPAIIALFLYSLLPLMRNTYIGIQGIDPELIEASKSVGLTQRQILLRVEIPIALPVILAGLRTAAVMVVGMATLAALIGAGGLGDPIFRGVSTVNSYLILLGAIPSALLAILIDKLIGALEKKLVSPGLLIGQK